MKTLIHISYIVLLVLLALALMPFVLIYRVTQYVGSRAAGLRLGRLTTGTKLF